MEITQDILDRLDQVIAQSGLSRRQFAISLGNSPSTITEIFSKRIKTFSGTFLKILELKHGINLTWLQTGAGNRYCNKIVVTNPKEESIIKNFRKLSPDNQKFFLLLSETFYLQQEVERDQRSLAHAPPEKKQKE